jgi:DNA-binding CsgD family transcriptional regulator/tetratricopeptide (TPR) repeat protein
MTMLLERDEELDHLQRSLAEAEQGRGRVAFVAGEAGIGKTAVVRALATATSSAGGRVRFAVGRCDALATPRALGPFLDVAATLGTAPSSDRDGLLDSLLDDLRGGPPALVIIEDAHWADDATVELIAMLGRRAVDLPLLLVVTYRDDETGSDHALRLVIGDLVTSSATSFVGLRSLSRTAVGRLAAGHDILAEDLYQLTCGNPFYVTEVLAAGAETVPPTVRMAVLTRISRLGPTQRSVIDAVSIVPGSAEPWLVTALCDPPSGTIESCVDAGVLVAGRDGYSFRHELARLAVESAVGDDRRRELNQRAVHELSARAGIEPARLAHHAAAAGDEPALARAAREACRLAIERSALREAVRHGEQALTVDHLLTPDERAAVREELGESLHALNRSDEAIVLLSEAVAHWQAVGDGRREAAARTRLSSPLGNVGKVERAREEIRRAVELLERDPPGPELAAAYTSQAGAFMLARDRDRAAEWGDKAIALARQLDDRYSLARALIQTGIADVMDGRFEGLTRIQEGIEIGRREDRPAVVALGLLQIGSGCGEMRRYAEAVPALIEADSVCERHHLESHRRYVVAWLARCRLDLGQWEEAEAGAREAASRSVGITRFVAVNTLGWLRARRGDADVWPLLDESLEIARRTGHLQRLWPVAVARAEAGALEGALDGHVELLEEVLDQARQCRHGVALGEIGRWLARAGRIDAAPAGAVDPFARWTDGDHLGAAAGFRRMGCPYEAASALADAGDNDSLREALATFERLGAAPMASEVAGRLRERGVRLGTRRSGSGTVAPDGFGLSARESEVLKLVAAGFTNPQIAASLYISRKTAEHHVSSILGKLGVASRTEAAAAAVRTGLIGTS